jgi:hypothetical protein
MAAPERFAEKSDSSCTAGTVHTWPITTDMALEPNVGFRGTAEVAGALGGCESIVSPQIFLFIY